MNYESNDQKFFQVALFAQEEFRARLQHPRFRNLVNRAAMSSSLENLSYAETVAMLRHRWLVAGGKSFSFTDQAIEQIYAYSQGITRTQVILADNALLAAFVGGASTIGPEIFTRWSRTEGYPIRNLRPLLARSCVGKKAKEHG
jgi:MSHA biogenesis protein MshM